MEYELINSDFYSDHAYFHSNIPDIHIPPSSMELGIDIDTNSIQLEAEALIDLEFLDHDEIFGFENAQHEELLENVELLTGEEDSHLGGCSLSDLLIMGAEAVESENWFLASTVVTKLNALLSSHENGENSLGRLALYFTEGLIYKCLHSPELVEASVLPIPQPSAISAFQMLHELSPYVKFAHFTANQAIMEAMGDSPGVHVVDFDIMEGMQWPPLMVDLAARQNASLRITAIVTNRQQLGRVQQTRIRLHEFADSIKLPFSFHEMLMTIEEDFEGIEAGETLVANCMLNQLHMPHRESSVLKTFLSGIKKRSPKIVILVEDELFNMGRVQSMSFVEFFCEAIQHYAAVSDSLRTGFGGEYNLAVKVIEREFLRTRILDTIKQYPSLQTQPSLSGFRQIPLSSCNAAQAKFLLSLFSGSYWVQNDKFKLALCWKARTLTTVSVWVPTT